MSHKITLDDIDLSQTLEDKNEYHIRLQKAQLHMLLIQRFLYQNNRSAVMVFEGWDAAGKGGSIRRVVEHIDPRGFEVHSVGAPTMNEFHGPYLQRFWARLPRPGRLGIFDRSWYGRVLVERVEGFCPKARWKAAFDEINAFEKMLVDEGVPVLKFFLHISSEEQLRRFELRKKDPFKSWKMTEEDWRNRERWADYEKAINAMLSKTSTTRAPWINIASEHKWFARVRVLEETVSRLEKTFGLNVCLPEGWQSQGD